LQLPTHHTGDPGLAFEPHGQEKPAEAQFGTGVTVTVVHGAILLILLQHWSALHFPMHALILAAGLVPEGQEKPDELQVRGGVVVTVVV